MDLCLIALGLHSTWAKQYCCQWCFGPWSNHPTCCQSHRYMDSSWRLWGDDPTCRRLTPAVWKCYQPSTDGACTAPVTSINGCCAFSNCWNRACACWIISSWSLAWVHISIDWQQLGDLIKVQSIIDKQYCLAQDRMQPNAIKRPIRGYENNICDCTKTPKPFQPSNSCPLSSFQFLSDLLKNNRCIVYRGGIDDPGDISPRWSINAIMKSPICYHDNYIVSLSVLDIST